MNRNMKRQVDKYTEQLNGMVQQLADFVAAGTAVDELKEIYEQLNNDWRRTAGFVNAGDRGFKLQPDAFEKQINKIVFSIKKKKRLRIVKVAAIIMLIALSVFISFYLFLWR